MSLVVRIEPEYSVNDRFAVSAGPLCWLHYAARFKKNISIGPLSCMYIVEEHTKNAPISGLSIPVESLTDVIDSSTVLLIWDLSFTTPLDLFLKLNGKHSQVLFLNDQLLSRGLRITGDFFVPPLIVLHRESLYFLLSFG